MCVSGAAHDQELHGFNGIRGRLRDGQYVDLDGFFSQAGCDQVSNLVRVPNIDS